MARTRSIADSHRVARTGRAILALTVLALATNVHAEHAGINLTPIGADIGLAAYNPSAHVAGRLTIAGSDTMQPLMTKLAQEFRRWHPDAKIAVQGSGVHLVDRLVDGLATSRRGDGNIAGHLGSQEVRLLASSRELTHEELKKFKARYGYAPLPIAVAQDAVAIYVHRDNPVPGLTLEELDAIFSKTRKRGSPQVLEYWGQLGLQGEWSDAPIHRYGRDQRSAGTRPFFKQLVLLDGEFQSGVGEQPGSASVVLAVSNDRVGIGYSGIGFRSSAVREVPLAERAGELFIPPTNETVTSGRYPLSRVLYLYVNKAPGEELQGVMKEFLTFLNTQPAQQVAAAAGVYPITSGQAASNLAKLGQAPLSVSALR